jgi:hypothetical protein
MTEYLFSKLLGKLALRRPPTPVKLVGRSQSRSVSPATLLLSVFTISLDELWAVVGIRVGE